MKPLLVLAAAAAIALTSAGSPGVAQFSSGIFEQVPDGVSLDSDFLVGRWTDNDDCGSAVEFNEDGSFVTAAGALGAWALEGDELIMSGTSTLTMRVAAIDEDTIEVFNQDGSHDRSTRCESIEPLGGPVFVI
jgi:hypothetical protein